MMQRDSPNMWLKIDPPQKTNSRELVKSPFGLAINSISDKKDPME
jgi:hypothetical protein